MGGLKNFPEEYIGVIEHFRKMASMRMGISPIRLKAFPDDGRLAVSNLGASIRNFEKVKISDVFL